MAGLSLSCFLPVLLEKLDSVLKLPGFPKQHEKSASLLESLKSALTSISKVITDAEKRQLKDQGVKIWLLKLEDAVYDAEDVLDEILYDETTPKLKADQSRNLKSGAVWLLPPHIIQKGMRIGSIWKIVDLIDGIAKDKNEFNFREQEACNEFTGLSESESDSLPGSTCLLDETAIYGREEDRSKIVSVLLSDSGDDNLDEIALIGEPGSGKTTLAQLVYKDEKVSKHFELKAWVDTSMDNDVLIIMRNILEATSFCSYAGYGLQELQDKLSETVAGKKFLLVLDGVWVQITKNSALKTSLKSGAKGSKIIVITRSEGVAEAMDCSTRYLLHPLTVGNCWSILAKSAFAGRDTREVEALEDIGWQIVEKCLGIPLLARAIGGLLRFKKTLEEWCHVLDDLKSLEIEAGDPILPILLLIYYRLPAQLKPCFAYCSLFPRDYEFDKKELVLLWEAEGFLQQSTAKSMVKVGAEYFNGLLKRSFFIPVDNSHFKMHHLMHELAVSASQSVCLRLELNAIMESVIPKRTRHLSLLSQHDSPDILSVIPETKRIRTFYPINSPSGHGSCQLGPAALKGIFASLQRLRVLSLSHFQDAELPASLGQLKYLRYLDFSDSALTSLPESLCTLYYLRTLILTNCSSLLMLPKGIVNLANLRKLHIKGAGLDKMPEEMSRLKNLQSLTNFIVGQGGSSIRELGALSDLHGSLSVSMLRNVSSASDALAANLEAMQYIDELELEWSYKNEDPAIDQEEVLENLKPSGVLKKLSIRFYGGKEFPKWLGDSSFLKITSLHLGDCKCELLPPLGQLSSLEHLIIERISGIKRIGHEFFGVDVSACKPFQSLKTLKFEEMSQWEEWILLEAEGNEFPCLEEFYIVNCPIFKGGLPKSLPALTKLEIANCEKLSASIRLTSECCVLKLDASYKVQNETQDRTLSKSDGEVASQFSSSMTQISGNELQLELNGINQNAAKEGALQEDLEPSGKLEKPSSGSDGGKEFPKWLEIPSISKMTSLCLSDYNNCSSLPPFGQLPFLEHLVIQSFRGIRSIGPEFYCLGFPFWKPFQSLKTLKFEAMPQWERWTPLEVEGEEFPCLLEFFIINCPKLEGDLPKRLPSLIKLEISECQQLGALLPWTSEHCVLKLEKCDKVQRRSDDNQTVDPQFSSSIMQQEQDNNQTKSSSIEDGSQQFSSTLGLNVSSIGMEQSMELPVDSSGIMQQEQDDNQTKSSSSEDGSQQFSSSLGLNVSSIGMEQSMELPVDSNSLRIERYASNMLPKEILERSSLQHLYIIDCIPLKIFPLSPSLKTLYIHNCKSIEFPQPNKVMNQDAQLEDFCLGSSCDSLKIFPLNYFPKLKSLSLWDCRNLEYLSIEKQLQNELTSLDALEIKDCPNLRSFLEEEFQAPNLTSLVFFNCGNLKSMQWMQSLKSLQSLYINKCPALESFPVEGLPSGLIILSISFCDKITPQKGWKLDKLHSLSHFEIEGGCQMLESFPEEGLLPTNLNSLRISRLLNLTSLDREGLQKLTSLQTLEINCCNKLDSLPENRLLSSLSSLSITDCSLLNPKLQSRKGKEWFKIAHITSIHLDEVSD